MLNGILKTIMILMMMVKMSVTILVGSCNECFDSNKIACLDETHFATCFQGSATPTITKCPANRFCTNHKLICHSSAEGYNPICYHDYCGDCEVTNGVFTCLDETTYGYCYGGSTPLKGSERSCPQGFVCNYNSRDICVPEDTHKPSCIGSTTSTTEAATVTTEIITIPTEPTTTDQTTTTITTDTTTTDQTTTTITTDPTTTDPTTTTITTDTTTTDQTTTTDITTEIAGTPTTQETESVTGSTTEMSTTPTIPTTVAPRDPNTICGEIGKTGYFKADDPTCRKYVYCYPLSGQYLGWVYYCDGYFNAATQKCQKEKPSDCIAH